MCGETQCLVKYVDGALTVIPARCKCWDCEDCRPARVARLKFEAKLGHPTLFITLTSRLRTNQTPARAAVLLAWAWRTVRAEYLRANGPRSLDFLAVFEDTKRGWPHLHIVARCKWIDQKWLSKRMGELIGSPVVWINRIKSRRKIANYVAKYIGKNPHRFEGTKRYWRSLHYLDPVDLEDAGPGRSAPCWQKIDCNWLNQVRYLEKVGFIAAYSRTSVVLRYGVPP